MLATAAAGESVLVLPFPADTGDIPAATYDADGRHVGDASLSLHALPGGVLRLEMRSAIEEGGRMEVAADLQILGDREGLRILRETSHSHDAKGESMGLLEIDHATGEARCSQPGAASDKAVVLPLPPADRVVNVPMNMLFLPLLRGEVEKIQFQLFLCRGGPRFVDFVAHKGGHATDGRDREIVEVRYAPDLGRLLSWAASPVLPELSFWFEAESGHYVAHRIPLYSKGPEVTVVREGFEPGRLPE